MSNYTELLQRIEQEPSTWLVTGVAGFIGSNLLQTLLSHGQRVVGLDNFLTGYQHNLDMVRELVTPEQWERFRFMEGDIRDVETCLQACQGAEHVLHEAALGSVPRSIENPIMTNGCNIDGFLNMLVAARDCGVKSFVYAASSSTYGDEPNLPKQEDRIGKPLSPYAVTKYVNELYAEVFARSYGFKTIGLRYFNVFGQRQDPYGAYAAVIPQWFAALTKGDTVYVNGDGETSRDFCYIDNVVQANLLASYAADDARNLVYNVAFGQRTTLNELFGLIRDEVVRHKPEAAEAKPAAKPAVLKPRADGGMLREITPRPQQAGNPYKPMLATVVETIQETGNIKTLRVVLDDPEQMANFTYEPGQVGQLSVFGAGESTFVINTPPSQKEYLQFSVMQAGEVTSAIHRLSPGDKVGVRAPLGNFFPYNDWKGKNIFFVGGGIGMAPIRTIMLHVLEHKADYGKVSLLYGARSPRDMAFSYELEGWLANPDLDCTLCIDNPYEGWPHKVGLIPNVLTELNPSPDNCVAVLCGPPIMIKFTLAALVELGFPDDQIYTTLEKRMKCGIGICGRCNIGSHYVCVDGPVFTMAQLKELPPEL